LGQDCGRRPGVPGEGARRLVAALFDTNILIDHLRGIPAAATELERYDVRAISAITWMEVLVGAPSAAERETRAFLDGFRLIGIDRAVAEGAVTLHRGHRLKLPDAIVWASARAHGMLLVTRDTKGFPADDPGVRIPYVV
jgi:predicted nucleic acid-binding protein